MAGNQIKQRIIRISVGLLIWITWLLLDLMTHHEFVGTFALTVFLLLVPVGVFLLGLVDLLFIGRRTWGKRKIVFSFIAFGYLLTNLLAAFGIYDHWYESSIEKGDWIAGMIENYRSSTGEYPLNLESLVPGWLPEKPVTEFPFNTRPYVYAKQADGFSLEFDAGGLVTCRLNDPGYGPGWVCDD